MGRLIKYEWKKQRISRYITLGLLLIFVIGMAVGIFWEREDIMGISIGTVMLATVFIMLYLGIESLVILNRDLKTKQSHMLWMVPVSSWTILGAKFIAAMLQIFFVCAAYIASGVALVAIAAVKNDLIGSLLEQLKYMVETLTDARAEWKFFIMILLLCFIGWMIVVMAGFLSIIISRTLFQKTKISGLISFVIFLLINMAVTWIDSLVKPLLNQKAAAQIFAPEVALYVVMGVVMFGIAGLLAEKKLSV